MAENKKTTEKPKINPKETPRGAAAAGPGPGRPKGCPNKMTVEVKKALEETFTKMGGIPAMVRWGKKNPDDFYKLWIKLLPKDINVTGTVTLEQLVAASLKDTE